MTRIVFYVDSADKPILAVDNMRDAPPLLRRLAQLLDASGGDIESIGWSDNSGNYASNFARLCGVGADAGSNDWRAYLITSAYYINQPVILRLMHKVKHGR